MHAIFILIGCFSLAFLIEVARLRNQVINEKIVKFWGPLMRSHEERQMSTVTHYLASVVLAVAIFPKTVAVLSILYLACGDPVASTFGILFGHYGPKLPDGRTLIGTLAGVVACTLVTFFYLNSSLYPVSQIICLSIVGGLAGGLAELFPFKIDDNFTIPIVSGFFLWFVFMILGI
jgi:diacylglycerol kinase (CTP)